jgi:outer membrane protein assembly factor BamA
MMLALEPNVLRKIGLPKKGIAFMTLNLFSRLTSAFLCVSIMLHAQDAPKAPTSNKIEAVEIRGAKRVPSGTLKALVTTKPGDTYDANAVQRDFDRLWNTGRFSDVSVKKDAGDHGGVVVRFTVIERAN